MKASEPSTADQLDLVADIGGTNARFALARHGCLERVVTLACAEHPSLAAAVRRYLDSVVAAPTRGALSVAGPVHGDRVEMTNRGWSFSIESLHRELGLERLKVLNDFAALARAVPALSGSDLDEIKPGVTRRGAPLAVLGPGTGLGVAAMVPLEDSWIAVPTEGGHRDLAATSEREWQVIGCLQERFGRASVERALSGPGLVNLYRAIVELDGGQLEELTPSEIVAAARERSRPEFVEAVHLFSGWLGAVAGDLALTFGAHGGIYLGGGMLSRMDGVFDHEAFRQRFLAKGRFRDYVEPIPVLAIVHPYAALIGAARALEARLDHPA